MHRFLHLGINFGGIPRPKLVESSLHLISTDWIRYAPNNWLLWTDRMPTDCGFALRDALSLNDQFAIFEINPVTRDGFHYQWIWDWIDRNRRSQLTLPQKLPTSDT